MPSPGYLNRGQAAAPDKIGYRYGRYPSEARRLGLCD